eukprot:1101323-Rhodomonas_salina.3
MRSHRDSALWWQRLDPRTAPQFPHTSMRSGAPEGCSAGQRGPPHITRPCKQPERLPGRFWLDNHASLMPCGSTRYGTGDPRVTKIALSSRCASSGKPWSCQQSATIGSSKILDGSGRSSLARFRCTASPCAMRTTSGRSVGGRLLAYA